MARQPSLYEMKMLGPEEISSEETKVFCLFPFLWIYVPLFFFLMIFLLIFSLSDSGEDFVPNWLLVPGTGA